MVQVTVTRQAHNASADYVWSKLAAYSDITWHPMMISSKNVGSIEDGSENMVGAVRFLEETDGSKLKETVTEWSEKERCFSISIDEGAPPFIKNEPQSMIITFRVREEEQKVYIDLIADLQLKDIFWLLTPIIKLALPMKMGPLADGIADLKEE
jgi:hypothetical protein